MTEHLWPFVGVAAVIIVVPGVDMALATRNTLLGGRAGGLRTIAGTLLGTAVHAGAAVVGLSSLIAASTTAFTVLKLAGAGYLLWLGLQAIWSARRSVAKSPLDASAAPRLFRSLARTSFAQGVVTNLLNPKLAVFFLSFLPQFVDPTRTAAPQIALLATTFIFMGAVWLTIYVLAIDSLSGVLTRSAVKQWMERIFGAALVALGVRLAVSSSK